MINMKNMKLFLLSCMTAAILLAACHTAVSSPFPSVSGMFKMNKELQEEGFYMAEFEFKMLGLAYNLDRGRFIKAYSMLRALEKQLKTRKGLIKVPEFRDKQEELEFYLSRQNPRTGAFMDDAYPYCTYVSPTANLLIHLDALAKETGQPLKLKYPLKFLDELNTPEKLKKYLDDVSTVGAIGLKFPQTSYHFARCVLSLFHEDNVIKTHNLYNITPEWDAALLKWFYDTQDPATGLWGPRSRSGKLRKKDTMNSASILKAFIDEDGNDIHKEYPLRYRDALAKSMISELSFRLPDDDDLDEWHEWNLNASKSVRTLYRYLWSGLSPDTREEAKAITERFLRIKFEKFYIAAEGAFSYYPKSEHATLDGTGGMITVYKELGSFSAGKFISLWGGPEAGCEELGDSEVAVLGAADMAPLLNSPGVNSVRYYAEEPAFANFSENVMGVFYPGDTTILDAVELIANIKAWLKNTGQSMGNWTSREDFAKSLPELDAGSISFTKAGLPIAGLNAVLKSRGKLVIIGFDALQIPKYKISFTYKD